MPGKRESKVMVLWSELRSRHGHIVHHNTRRVREAGEGGTYMPADDARGFWGERPRPMDSSVQALFTSGQR